jgi:hypothetical protein
VGTRRTRPYYLSDDEAAREERRTRDMVHGFLNYRDRKNQKPKICPTKKVGETENFVVEYDTVQDLILVCERHNMVECPFKVGFNKYEIDAIIKLLSIGKQLALQKEGC